VAAVGSIYSRLETVQIVDRYINMSI